MNVGASTSINKINADKGLTLLSAAAYILLNKLNNAFPQVNVDRHMDIRSCQFRNLERDWHLIPLTVSPSRAMSDLFWHGLDWEKLAGVLGRPIRIFDLGCGTGRYGPLLILRGGGRIASYLGVDIVAYENWEVLSASDPRFSFINISANASLENSIPSDTNFIMSQSALEHIENDLAVMKSIHRFSISRQHPILQIHLVPTGFDFMKMYGLHGFRQYMPRTISKITKHYGKSFRVGLLGLGGKACIQMHWQYIRGEKRLGQRDRRAEDPEKYNAAMRAAIERDMMYPGGKTCFYALIIATPRWEGDIWAVITP